jgi:hypothetical protein
MPSFPDFTDITFLCVQLFCLFKLLIDSNHGVVATYGFMVEGIQDLLHGFMSRWI